MGNTCHIMGDVSLPDGDIQASVNEIIQEEGFTDSHVSVDVGSKKGDNYTGNILRIIISGNGPDGNPKKMSFIAKCATKIEALREAGPHNLLFERETFMYTEVMPTLFKMQQSYGIKNGFSKIPILYKYSLEDRDEFMIFDDKMVENFVMKDRKETLNWDHCALVIKQLAHLHAFSFVLKEQKPDLFAEYIKTLKDNMWEGMKHIDMFKVSLKTYVDKAIKSLDAEKDAEAIEKYAKFGENIFDHMFKFFDVENNDEYCIIIHGDCWNNNLLFKYENEDNMEKPTEICFLDFQISRCASPVVELAYFIYNCTGTKFRDEHFDDLLQLYYDTLSNAIRYMECDPDKLFPYSVFQDHLKKYFHFGVVMTTQTIHIFTSESEEIPNMADVKEFNEEELAKWNFESKNVDLYNDRMSGVIRHAVSRGYI